MSTSEACEQIVGESDLQSFAAALEQFMLGRSEGERLAMIEILARAFDPLRRFQEVKAEEFLNPRQIQTLAAAKKRVDR